MERKIETQVKGFHAIDGGGVHLVRVLGNTTVKAFNPFLMLDSFDSTNPEDYVAGFPMHPHRGIETITFVAHGNMRHKDSMGFEDIVQDGEVQYMSAGSGILHEETIPASPRMCGLQLWLNLSAKDKMTKPSYKAIKKNEIPEVPLIHGKVRVLMGNYEGTQGYQSHHLPLDYYDIHLDPGASLTWKVDRERAAMGFTLQGEVIVAGNVIPEKTAVRFTEGDTVTITAGKDPVEFMFMSSLELDDPIHWGGPIVMDTREGLLTAFQELETGTFLKDKMDVEK